MERKDKFFKTKNAGMISHRDRLDHAIHKQFQKHNKERVARFASNRSFHAFVDDNLELEKCVNSLERGEPLTESIIQTFNFNYQLTGVSAEVALTCMHKVQLIERIVNSLEDTKFAVSDGDGYILAISNLLLTLSQGNVEAIRLAFAVTPYLIKLVHRKISIQPIPQFLIYNIFWTMGNICFNDPTLRYELVWLDLVATSLSFVELCHCAASTLAMTCWFLSIFADSRLPLQLLQGATSMAEAAIRTGDEEATLESLWLLCTLNDIHAHRHDFFIDRGLLEEPLKVACKSNYKFLEPMLYIIGSASKDQYESFDNNDVAMLLGSCWTADDIQLELVKTGFSVACKLAIGIKCPSFITLDFIFQHMEGLIRSDYYSLHIEIIHFIDFLLANQYAAILHRIHFFCIMIVNHLSYLFIDSTDLEVVTILIEVILYELTTHNGCELRELVMNSSIGEALENLSLLSQDIHIRNISGKLVDLLFNEDENVHASTPSHCDEVVVVSPVRMGRGSAAVKPAWMM